MLPSQQQGWMGKNVDSASSSVTGIDRYFRKKKKPPQKAAASECISAANTATNKVEAEATLRLLADPQLYAEFLKRLRGNRHFTNATTQSMLKDFLAEKKYCDCQSRPASRCSEQFEVEELSSPALQSGKLHNFLSKREKSQNSLSASASVPSLDEISEASKFARRESLDLVSIGNQSKTSISTCETAATDLSIEVSLGGGVLQDQFNEDEPFKFSGLLAGLLD